MTHPELNEPHPLPPPLLGEGVLFSWFWCGGKAAAPEPRKIFPRSPRGSGGQGAKGMALESAVSER